jgi:hypothetical protein
VRIDLLLACRVAQALVKMVGDSTEWPMRNSGMSLTITSDRTEAGRFRAEVAEHYRFVIERDELSALVEELKQNLDRIAVMADGRLLLIEAKARNDSNEAVARAAVERTALCNEELDKLIDRHPVPAEWGSEPGWCDAR